MTELLISVSHWTTPLNLDMPALTVTMPAETSTVLALIVSLAGVIIVTPAVSSLIEFPLLSSIMMEPGPSFSVIF